MTPAILGIARHLLTIGAGALVARGVIDGASADTLVGAGAAIVGAGAAIVGVVWSVLEKRAR